MTQPRYTFGPKHRIRKRSEFDAVFSRKQRAFEGPLGIYVAPNGLTFSRLGISMSRRIGSAVRRNYIKRLLREAFRLSQHEMPKGWDLVIVPKPHDPLPLADYIAAVRLLLQRATERKVQA